MTLPDPFIDLAIALGLGLLVGLQRESRHVPAAGLRTFALVTLCGTLSALLSRHTGGWVVGAGLLAIAGFAAISHYATTTHDGDSGMTTEVALLAMYLIGAGIVLGDRRLAVVLGGTVAVLLQAKAPFKKAMERLGEDDVRAIIKFALLSLVILPVLPDEAFGPWSVFNLFEIWLLVVLIVGINLAGYIAWKFVGSRGGALLGGLLGGVISSTATTVSYSRRTKESADAAPLAAVVIMIATAVVVVRVLIEVAVVAPGLLGQVAIPIGIVLAAAMVLSLAVWWRAARRPADVPEQENPTMLRAALLFAAVYAVVLLAVAWVRHAIGDSGLYYVAVVAGLTDVDAITLSTAKMASLGQLEPGRAWRVILIAFASNLAFKIGIVAVLGSRRLLLRVAILFALLGAVVGAVVLLYP
ncbi:MAG: MgtC/SapB family protein [Thermoanaerobaculia bacterium]